MTVKTTPTVDSPDKPLDVWFGFELAKAEVKTAHRNRSPFAVQAEDVYKMKALTFERTRKGIEQWAQHAAKTVEPGQSIGVVMEVTSSYSLEVAAWLKAICPQVQISIVPGKRTRQWAHSLGIDEKNDDLDARVLACYGAERQPPPTVMVGELYQKLRSLSRTRLEYVEQRVAIKQRLEEAGREHLDPQISKTLKRSLSKVESCLTKQIELLEAEMKKLIKQDAQLAADVEVVDTITGVGWHTAVTVLVEVGDLRAFVQRNQVVSCVGLNPVIRKSGTSVNKRIRISKKGSSRARRALFLAVLSTIRTGGNPFSDMYHRLVDKGKKKMVALVAVMRKMITVMRAVVISGTPYDPNYEKASNA